MKGDKASLTASGLSEPTRLDKVLKTEYSDWGRSAIKSLLNGRKVSVNGQTVWLGSWKIHNGDQIEVSDPPEVQGEWFTKFDNVWLVSEEADLIVVNKPFGLLVHATRGKKKYNLYDFAQQRFGDLTLFHRLDRDTSGIVLLTRTHAINRYLDKAFKAHEVQKEYLAVVPADNDLQPAGVIDAYLGPHPTRRDLMAVVERGGKPAVTAYEALDNAEGLQVLRLRPKTGRMHQLRVHLAHLNAPILGDILYAPKPIYQQAGRLLLHARRITLPESADFPQRTYTAPVPADYLEQLPAALRGSIIHA
ncbi:MAG: RluA family pseudouridine synthase [Anaerolineales bacterium]|nr:RluA family pseudouridine synthase [Anaerolineales bacterium]